MKDKPTALTEEIAKYDYLFEHNARYASNAEHPRYDLAEKFLDKCGLVRLVVDVGAGRGIFMERLRKRGLEVFGVEPSRVAVEQAASPRLVLGTCDEIPFASNLFDVVFCLDVMEHIPRELTERSLAELRRVAKKYVILSVANHEDVVEDRELHINLRPYEEWRELISRYFTIVDGEMVRSRNYPDRTAEMYRCEKR